MLFGVLSKEVNSSEDGTIEKNEKHELNKNNQQQELSGKDDKKQELNTNGEKGEQNEIKESDAVTDVIHDAKEIKETSKQVEVPKEVSGGNDETNEKKEMSEEKEKNKIKEVEGNNEKEEVETTSESVVKHKEEHNEKNEDAKIIEKKDEQETASEVEVSTDTLKKKYIEDDAYEKNISLAKELEQQILLGNNLFDKLKKLFESQNKIDPKELHFLKGAQMDLDRDELVKILINQIKQHKEKIQSLEKKKSRFNFLSNAMIVLNLTILSFLAFSGVLYFFLGKKRYCGHGGKKKHDYFDYGETKAFYKDVPQAMKKFIKKPFGFGSNESIYEPEKKDKFLSDYFEGQSLKESTANRDIYYSQEQPMQTNLKEMNTSNSEDSSHDGFLLNDIDSPTHSERKDILSPESASFTTLGDSPSSSIPSLEDLDDNPVNIHNI